MALIRRSSPLFVVNQSTAPRQTRHTNPLSLDVELSDPEMQHEWTEAVREDGRPVQRCRVLRSVDDDGAGVKSDEEAVKNVLE